MLAAWWFNVATDRATTPLFFFVTIVPICLHSPPSPPPSAAPPVAGFFQKDRVNEKGPGTRCYKAPELCLRYDFYGYAVDLWAFGCMFGSMIFLEHPLIRGKGSWFNQLLAITKVRRWLPLPVLSCP